MTDNPLGLRRSDPIDLQTIEDVPLPKSIMTTLEEAARNAGLQLGEAVAQIIIDRVAERPAQSRKTRAAKEPKRSVRSSIAA